MMQLFLHNNFTFKELQQERFCGIFSTKLITIGWLLVPCLHLVGT